MYSLNMFTYSLVMKTVYKTENIYGHRLVTDWSQTGYRLDTDWSQNGDRPVTAGHRLVTAGTIGYKVVTKWSPYCTGRKPM